ncbi:hypothetical protein SUGI_0437760 [Cryptomeria japonica]|nr:hypothetical protein SUGI_0437760 [Cryptomeria japonica]
MGGEMSKANYVRVGQDPDWENQYKEACKTDLEVKNFHDKLEDDLEGFVSAEGGMSLDSLRKATSIMAEKDQQLKDLILKNKKDIWKDRNLNELVELYRELNTVNKNLYNELNNCLVRMSCNQGFLEVALQCIAPSSNLPGKAQYTKCKEKLVEFQKAENPFNEKFSSLLKSVLEQNNQILGKLKAQKKKLDKKFKLVRLGRRISFILFAMVAGSCFIFSVLGAAMFSPPLAVAIVATPTILSGPSAWLFSRLTKYENKIKIRREVVDIMQKVTYKGLNDLNLISFSADQLKGSIDLILLSVDFYCKGEDHQKIAVEDIRKKRKRFKDQIDKLKNEVDDIRAKQQSVKDQIDDLHNHVDRCIQELQNNSSQILLKNTRD